MKASRNQAHLEVHLVSVDGGMASNGGTAGAVQGSQEGALADDGETGILVVKAGKVLL